MLVEKLGQRILWRTLRLLSTLSDFDFSPNLGAVFFANKFPKNN